MSLLIKPVDNCDRCKMSIRAKDLLVIGEMSGHHEKSWWKVCPKCYETLYRKYVIPTVKVDKRAEKILNMDELDIKIQLERHSKLWRQF